jgi:hydroxyacylglutathione hydrolase
MFGGMRIETILILEDNYTYLLYDRQGGRAAVVDPGEASAVARRLFSLDLRLTHLLITHHHPDHTAGIAELLRLGTLPRCSAATSTPRRT